MNEELWDQKGKDRIILVKMKRKYFLQMRWNL